MLVIAFTFWGTDSVGNIIVIFLFFRLKKRLIHDPLYFFSPDRHLDRNPHQLAWCQRHTILKQLLDVTNQIQEHLFFLHLVSNKNHKFFVSELLFLTIQISNYKECCTTGNLKNQVIKNWPMREAHLKREYLILNDRADHLLLLNWYLHMLVLIKSLIQAVKIAAKILPILELFSTIDSFSNPKLEIDIGMWLVVTLLHN